MKLIFEYEENISGHVPRIQKVNTDKKDKDRDKNDENRDFLAD